MINIRFSKNYEAVKSRIRRLPKFIENSADTVVKKDAVSLIDTFQEGIRKGTFNLEKLKPETIARKVREGKKQPDTPLYGEGDDVDNSYINMFKIRKIKKGYRVYARWAKHESGLQLRDLFSIHEQGRLIRRGDAIIRIPPRPAFLLASNKFVNKKIREENVEKVRDAMRTLIRQGNDTKFRKLISEKLDKHDET